MKIDEVVVGWAKTRKRCAQQERAWTERKKCWERFAYPNLRIKGKYCILQLLFRLGLKRIALCPTGKCEEDRKIVNASLIPTYGCFTVKDENR